MTDQELADHIEALRSGIERAQTDRAGATSDIDRCQVELDDAIYEGSDAVADRAERHLKSARRKLQRSEIVLKRLCPLISEAREEQRARRVAPCVERMLAAHDDVFRALQAVLEANARERAVYQACVAELGHDVAEARIPRGHCAGLAIGPEAVDHWRRSRQNGFGRGEARPAPNGLVAVTFVRDYRQYSTGETAGFTPREALALVDKGVAEATPDAVAGIVALPPDPRKAMAPAPGPDGRVRVLVVRSFSEDIIGLGVVNGVFTPGDVAAFPLNQATRYVRQGYAEFVETGSGDDPVSTAENRSDDDPNSSSLETVQ